ncbi:MAG: phosphoglucomutase/phosphomannomutase family protein [Candidatus Sericytochromatia bacterium]|nr:phosphoglucomutase/phosphomannomutase family protein [Candidatus Sericytochromatia bacterium]
MTQLVFGTDGWRARRGTDFTSESLARVTEGVVAAWREEDPTDERPVLVGGDTREGSAEGVGLVAGILCAAGFKVQRVEGPVTTPNMSHAVVRRGARGALVLTASHNPSSWNGLKIKRDFGGSAEPEFTRRVEACIPDRPRISPVAALEVPVIDPRPDYLEALGHLVDLQAIRAAMVRPERPLRVVFDAMHGASAGYLPRLLAGPGFSEIRSSADPAFGGVHPEPIPPHLLPLQQVLAAGLEPAVGLACDGDGDRIGAVAEGGRFVNPHVILALLARHLAEVRKWPGAIVKTLSTSTMIDRLAGRHGRDLSVVPIGFKYVAAEMRAREVLIGGEESGGIGFPRHLPERDGLLSALLLLEACVHHGSGLGSLVDDLMDEFGPHAYDRRDVSLEAPGQVLGALAALGASPPGAVAGLEVVAVTQVDGLKFDLEGGAWLLLRPSGTEPLLRLYAEARDPSAVVDLLAEGARLAGLGGRGA